MSQPNRLQGTAKTRLVAEDENRSRLLAPIVDSSDDAIMAKTLDGTRMSWNCAAERIYGYTAKEVTGKRVTLPIQPHRGHHVWRSPG